MSNMNPAMTGAVDLSVLLPPYKTITLPSAGMFGDTPAEVSVRGMTVKELKQLTTGHHLDGSAIDAILRSCIKEQLDLSKLLVVDYNTIALNIRLATQASKTEGVQICPHCRSRHKVTYDLAATVELTYASDVIPKSKMVKMERISEALNRVVEFEVKPLLRGDYIRMESILQDAKLLASKTGQPLKKFPMEEIIKIQIRGVHGIAPTVLPPESLVDYLNEDDADEVVAAFENIGASIKGSVNCQCPICRQSSVYEVPFTDLFFR